MDEGASVTGGEEPAGVRRRWSRRRRVVVALLSVLLVALVALWIERRTIARHFVDGELARRGVPARYEIEQLSPWRQRLTNVVIGDPANPDLTADWIELRTSLLPWRLDVLVARANKLRMRGRLVDGKLSLGSLDKLMPPPSGKPFALPHMSVDLADGQMALATPYGPVTLGFFGKGMLDDGFAGTLAATANRFEIGGCDARWLSAGMALRIERGQPVLRGPLRAQTLTCGALRVDQAQLGLGVRGSAALDAWAGNAGVSLGRVEQPRFRVDAVTGRVSFTSDRRGVRGDADLGSGPFRIDAGSGAALAAAGRYSFGAKGFDLSGRVRASDTALAPATLATLRNQANAGAGTPLGPIVAQIVRAATAAGRSFGADAAVDVRNADGRTILSVSRIRASAASGALLRLDRGEGFRLNLADAGWQVDGMLTLEGGGLPRVVASLQQAAPGAPITGRASIDPIAAGGARLALAPVAFSAALDGATRIETVATLSGPLGDGRAEGLRVPVEARWAGGRLVVNTRCAAAGFDRLAMAGMVLNRAQLRLCPTGEAMVLADRRGLGGGVRVIAPRLAGTLNGSPLTLAAGNADYALANGRFTARTLAARLGSGSAVTRIDIGSLDGRVRGGAVAGGFTGLGGQIGSVPLLLSEGAGRWDFTGGRLHLAGALTVSDAVDPARFHPLAARGAELTLANNRIVAAARLETPGGTVKVADARIEHDLGKGEGQANLDVTGIRFAEGGFQPAMLTELTKGVIADVSGTLSGKGQIRWNREGVKSDGIFRTDGMDLAASFGPVRKLSTEIHFTDLLNLETAPDQVATVGEVNPGVPVTSGTIRYRLLSGLRVQVDGVRWPFAGGELVLEPTVMDFSKQEERRLVFRVVGADAAQFLKELAFDNLNATGTFDGVLPILFDERGGRIEGGHLAARGGGSIAYIGTVTQEDLGTWGNIAFQALRSINYKSLGIEMNGPLDGEIITQINFAGISQGEGAKSNFLIRRLQKLPFVFNIQIRAPFRQLLDSVQSWYEPSRLIERNLPELLEQQRRNEASGATATPAPVIQPPESEKLP